MGSVQSIDRMFNILEEISIHDDGIGISDLSDKVNLHKSTVHRLVSSLIENGYVKQQEDTKYKITHKLYEIGVRSIAKQNIAGASRDIIKNLARTTGEVIHLVVRNGVDIVYIDKETPYSNTALMGSTIGSSAPIYRTSAGKAMLFEDSIKQIKKLWDSSKIEQKTRNTITDYHKFKKEISSSIARGYATDNEENELGIFCIGAPIYNYKNEICAGISLSAPVDRVKENINDYSKSVKDSAFEISLKMGYLP